MTRYIPVNASEFLTLLKSDKGWVKTFTGNEIVFDKELKNGNVIRVLTSIRNDNGECRDKGGDAIRICAFNPHKNRGVAKTQRVYRVAGWQDRVKNKVTSVFVKVK